MLPFFSALLPAPGGGHVRLMATPCLQGFRLKPNVKVKVEFGLVAVAHNIRKLIAVKVRRGKQCWHGYTNTDEVLPLICLILSH